MSRSRKRNPVVSSYSRSCTRFYKRMASKTVRKYKGHIPDGNHYRKVFCSWNIFDYQWRVHICDEHIKHPERKMDDYYGVTHEDLELYYRK